MTVKFGPTINDLQNFYNQLGKTVELHIKGFASDEHCAAILVQPSMNIHVSTATPHITVAHSGATKPVYSNQLVMSKNRVMHVNESTPLISILLAVKHNQSQVWPEVGYALASSSLTP